MPTITPYRAESKNGGWYLRNIARELPLAIGEVSKAFDEILPVWDLLCYIWNGPPEGTDSDIIHDIYRVLVPPSGDYPGYRVNVLADIHGMMGRAMGPLLEAYDQAGATVTESDDDTGDSLGVVSVITSPWGNEDSYEVEILGSTITLKRVNVLATRSPGSVDAYSVAQGAVVKSSLDELIASVITESRRVVG